MSLLLFVGPTISHAEVSQYWKNCRYKILPPVKQGDIYLATESGQMKPTAIGIIDGYFESQPAVWHKEILWAMAQGIHVFGAASMGALRAAELTEFGMQGIGDIFDGYNSGELHDDDEVTVIHGNDEQAYISYSDAMVNIRASLNAAADDKIISDQLLNKLLVYAKQLHYAQRSYPIILDHVCDLQTKTKLKNYLNKNAINLKYQDAKLLLETMASQYQSGFEKMKVNYMFQYTENWQFMLDKLQQRGNQRSNYTETSQSETQLRIENHPDLDYLQLKTAARFRSMAIQESYRQSVVISEKMLASQKIRFCQDFNFINNGEIDIESIQEWLRDQNLKIDEFDFLMNQQARYQWYTGLTQSQELGEIIDYMKISGIYNKITI